MPGLLFKEDWFLINSILSTSPVQVPGIPSDAITECSIQYLSTGNWNKPVLQKSFLPWETKDSEEIKTKSPQLQSGCSYRAVQCYQRCLWTHHICSSFGPMSNTPAPEISGTWGSQMFHFHFYNWMSSTKIQSPQLIETTGLRLVFRGMQLPQLLLQSTDIWPVQSVCSEWFWSDKRGRPVTDLLNHPLGCADCID